MSNVLCAAKTWATTNQGGDQETGVLAVRRLTRVGLSVSSRRAPSVFAKNWTAIQCWIPKVPWLNLHV